MGRYSERQKRKNPPRGGFFGRDGATTPDLRGNRFGGTVLPKHPSILRHEGARIKQNSLETLLPMAAAFGALACLQGLGSRVVPLVGAVVGPNGETLQTAQTRSGAPQHR